MGPYAIDALISAQEIDARVGALAAEIDAAFADSPRVVLVGLLRGSFIFLADLARRVKIPVEVEFMEVSSYDDTTFSSKDVRIIKDIRIDIEGCDIIIIEDIIDTGHTLKKVLRLMEDRRPRRLEVCALLDKPSRRETEVAARWIGFTIPDVFVVGYGIDYAQTNRNLPYVGSVRFMEKDNGN